MNDLSGSNGQFQRLRLGSIKWHLQVLIDAVGNLEAELGRADEAHAERMEKRCDDLRVALQIEWLQEYVSDIEWPSDGLVRKGIRLEVSEQ